MALCVRSPLLSTYAHFRHAPTRLMQGKPTLRIGHHLLEGTIVVLPRPLAILHRERGPSSADTLTPTETEASASDTNVPMDIDAPSRVDAPTYTVRAFVRKKLVFGKRPMPIVGAGKR